MILRFLGNAVAVGLKQQHNRAYTSTKKSTGGGSICKLVLLLQVRQEVLEGQLSITVLLNPLLPDGNREELQEVHSHRKCSTNNMSLHHPRIRWPKASDKEEWRCYQQAGVWKNTGDVARP